MCASYIRYNATNAELEAFETWDNFYNAMQLLTVAPTGYTLLNSVAQSGSFSRAIVSFQALRKKLNEMPSNIKASLIYLRNAWNGAVNGGNNFFANVDDFAATFDQAGTVSAAIRQQAYNLYNAKNWNALEDLFNQNNLNWGWPPANGGYNIVDNVPLSTGMKFDRYGSALGNFNGQGTPNLGGNFTSPMPNGTSYTFGQRALNQAENTYDFHYEIEILTDLPFTGQSGDVIPWFGRVGEGKQTMWKIPIDPETGYMKTWNKLAQEGYIKITIKNSPSGNFNNLIGTVIQ